MQQKNSRRKWKNYYGKIEETTSHIVKSSAENNRNNVTDASKTIYRIGHSDIFGCHNCNKAGDKWFMQQHSCSNMPEV